MSSADDTTAAADSGFEAWSDLCFGLPTPALQLEALFTRACAEVQRGVGQGGIALTGLDAVSRRILAGAALPLPDGGDKNSALPDTLYLVTEIYAAGGHRLLLEQMIRSRPQDLHRVLFTGTLQRTASFSLKRMADLGVPAEAPDPALVLWDKFLWLRERLVTLAPKRIVLVHHSEDVVAALLAQDIAPAYGRRLIMLRHSDTVASLGADLDQATHLAMNQAQAENLRAACPSLAVALLPLCYDPDLPPPRLVAEIPAQFVRAADQRGRGQRLRRAGWQALRRMVWMARRARFAAMRQAVAWRPSAGMGPTVTATCGTQHKFTLEGPLALPAVIVAVLQATGGRHVHIGPVSAPFRAALRESLRQAGIAPQRLRFAGEVPSVATALRWYGVSLYLGSFPVSGALSRAEAAWAGLPIAVLQPAEPDPLARYMAGLDAAPPDMLLWDSAATLAQALRDLLPARRHAMGSAARDWYDATLSPVAFAAHLDTILAALPPAPPVRPSVPVALPLPFAVLPGAALAEIRPLRLAPAAALQSVPVHPAADLYLARPRVVAATHIAPDAQTGHAPAVMATCWPMAEVVGGADGFVTAEGEWYDPGLDGFDPAYMQLRHPGPVTALQQQQVHLIRHTATGHLPAAILACGCYSHNYFHFLLEVLPRALAAARIAPEGTPILTEDDLPLQHYQALRLALPCHPVLRLSRGASVTVERLYTAGMGTLVQDAFAPAQQQRAAGLRYHPATVTELAALRAVGQGATGPEKLFLWRGSKARRLRNALALRRQLTARGFILVETAEMSFADQIRLMANARVIVAQSGAQLANTVFAPPDCRIFVLFSDAPGVDYRLWSALVEPLGHEVINLVGPHVPSAIGIHADFTLPEGLLLPFFDSMSVDLPLDLFGILSSLHGLSFGADVLTGSWAVLASGTPSGFVARLSGLRRGAVLGVLGAEGGSLGGILGHGFFADYGRSLRSGFAAFADMDADLLALGDRIAARLSGLGAGVGEAGDVNGTGAVPAGTEPVLSDGAVAGASGDAGSGAFAGAERLFGDGPLSDDDLRRLLLLGMLLVPNWRVGLPRDPGALPGDVLDRWLHWATVPPFLHRAGEDAAWVGHVARLLDWVADRLDGPDTARTEPVLVPTDVIEATAMAGRPSVPAVDAALRARLLRLVTGLDLGQLLLVDVPLGAVQAARNRVLEHVALRSGSPRAALRPAVATTISAGTEPVSHAVQGPRRRIGLLCRTFEKGPDSEAVVAFFQAFDPARYEIYAYSIGFRDRVVSRDPAFDARFDAAIAHRRELPGDPAGIRAQLLADDLDVFLYANATTYGIQPMDIAIYHRVAPLQAVLNSHLPMAMGYPSFDAVLTGLSDDPGQEVDQAQHRERLLRVPGPVISYLTTLQPRKAPALDRAALGLRDSDVVMMNAGSLLKLRHQCLFTMMRAVAEVPDGVLLLAPYNPGWAARSLAFAFNAQLAETAAAAGLAMERIVVLGELSVAEAEAALACADIYLNPFPHGGATMTHLALIYGVPPVTLRRGSTRSIDQFLVGALGFDELLASSPEEYAALAVALGRDAPRRRALAARLREAARHPVFVDSPEHSRAMQAALEQLMADA